MATTFAMAGATGPTDQGIDLPLPVYLSILPAVPLSAGMGANSRVPRCSMATTKETVLFS